MAGGALLIAGCAGAPGTPPPTPAAPWPDRLQSLLPADVLLMGEQHDAPDHQRLQREAVQWLVEKRIEHLVLDVPSVDRTHDEGHLVGHRIFFGLPAGSTARGDASRSRATVTELAFIPDEVHDGPCILSLAVPAIGGDAVPSQPIVYPLAP